MIYEFNLDVVFSDKEKDLSSMFICAYCRMPTGYTDSFNFNWMLDISH